MVDGTKLLGLAIMTLSIPMTLFCGYLGVVNTDTEYAYTVGLFLFSSFMGYVTYSVIPLMDKTKDYKESIKT